MKNQDQITLSCSRCSSILILRDTITEHREGERTPITLMVYKCSNIVCQEAIDKETADRIKSRNDRDKARELKVASFRQKKELPKA